MRRRSGRRWRVQERLRSCGAFGIAQKMRHGDRRAPATAIARSRIALPTSRFGCPSMCSGSAQSVHSWGGGGPAPHSTEPPAACSHKSISQSLPCCPRSTPCFAMRASCYLSCACCLLVEKLTKFSDLSRSNLRFSIHFGSHDLKHLCGAPTRPHSDEDCKSSSLLHEQEGSKGGKEEERAAPIMGASISSCAADAQPWFLVPVRPDSDVYASILLCSDLHARCACVARGNVETNCCRFFGAPQSQPLQCLRLP